MSRWLREAEEDGTVFFQDDTFLIRIYESGSSMYYVVKAYKKIPGSTYNIKACCFDKDRSFVWGYTKDPDSQERPNSAFEAMAPASWMEGEQISQWNAAVQEVLNKVEESNND